MWLHIGNDRNSYIQLEINHKTKVSRHSSLFYIGTEKTPQKCNGHCCRPFHGNLRVCIVSNFFCFCVCVCWKGGGDIKKREALDQLRYNWCLILPDGSHGYEGKNHQSVNSWTCNGRGESNKTHTLLFCVCVCAGSSRGFKKWFRRPLQAGEGQRVKKKKWSI
jgi:hypothetical protein